MPGIPDEKTGSEASDLSMVPQRAKPEPIPASVQPWGTPHPHPCASALPMVIPDRHLIFTALDKL